MTSDLRADFTKWFGFPPDITESWLPLFVSFTCLLSQFLQVLITDSGVQVHTLQELAESSFSSDNLQFWQFTIYIFELITVLKNKLVHVHFF